MGGQGAGAWLRVVAGLHTTYSTQTWLFGPGSTTAAEFWQAVTTPNKHQGSANIRHAQVPGALQTDEPPGPCSAASRCRTSHQVKIGSERSRCSRIPVKGRWYGVPSDVRVGVLGSVMLWCFLLGRGASWSAQTRAKARGDGVLSDKNQNESDKNGYTLLSEKWCTWYTYSMTASRLLLLSAIRRVKITV